MLTIILALISPVIIWLLVMKFLFDIDFTWSELVAQFGVTFFIVLVVVFLSYSNQTADDMFVNGEITKLEPIKKNCNTRWSRSKDSFCTKYKTRQVYDGQTCTTVNKSRVCTPRYHTEYKSIYSWERRYFVMASYMNYPDKRYEIRRVDRQGVETPPRFAELTVGDPTTMKVNYVNYIKGASSSLFSEMPPKEDDVVLAYPKVRQQFEANKVIVSNLEFDSDIWRAWNKDLAATNTLIRSTGANVMIILTGRSNGFAEMLARAWDAHNINDVVVTIGMAEDGSIKWIDVRSWSKDSLVDVSIRDAILDVDTSDSEYYKVIDNAIGSAVLDYFRLRDMSEFEYLAEEITPSPWVILGLIMVLLIITPGLTYFFNKHDVF